MNRTLLLALAAVACAKDPVDLTDDSPTADAVDVRVTDADVGALGPDQLMWTGAEQVVEPGADVMFCQFGTYTGPDVGLHDVHTYQGAHGHHFQLMGTTTPAIDAPDGTVVDCTSDGDFDMGSLEPIGVPNEATVDGALSPLAMPLPDGMAIELESGQRYVLQSHYLNTTADPIRVQDKVVLSTVPTEDVETWAAPLIFNRDDFEIPARGALTQSFDCTAEADWNVLYMLGHMHEWGSSYAVDEVGGERVYDVPTWDPVYRDAPVVMDHTDDPMQMPLGSTWKTTCSWANDTDEVIVFPHEMCATVSLVYPQKTTVVCDGNGQ
jgi:hypothetical protein